jgi:hypothetical protein
VIVHFARKRGRCLTTLLRMNHISPQPLLRQIHFCTLVVVIVVIVVVNLNFFKSCYFNVTRDNNWYPEEVGVPFTNFLPSVCSVTFRFLFLLFFV